MRITHLSYCVNPRFLQCPVRVPRPEQPESHQGHPLLRGFSEEEWSEHQRITYVALLVLGIDGMQRMARACLLEGAAELV